MATSFLFSSEKQQNSFIIDPFPLNPFLLELIASTELLDFRDLVYLSSTCSFLRSSNNSPLPLVIGVKARNTMEEDGDTVEVEHYYFNFGIIPFNVEHIYFIYDTFDDQGWGNRKISVSSVLERQEFNSKKVTFTSRVPLHTALHQSEKVFETKLIELYFETFQGPNWQSLNSVIQGDRYYGKYSIGGGGGHKMFSNNLRMILKSFSGIRKVNISPSIISYRVPMKMKCKETGLFLNNHLTEFSEEGTPLIVHCVPGSNELFIEIMYHEAYEIFLGFSQVEAADEEERLDLNFKRVCFEASEFISRDFKPSKKIFQNPVTIKIKGKSCWLVVNDNVLGTTKKLEEAMHFQFL